MSKDPSNNNNTNTYSEITNISKESIICKDGFCSLPEIKENPKVEQNKTNIFDPI